VVNLREKLVGLTISGTAAPAFRPTEQGELYRGYEKGFSRGFEVALTPAILGAIGYGLDRWIGIVPVLTILFVLVGVVGVFARMWYSYDANMREQEARAPWAAATAPNTATNTVEAAP
jgi:hypothetical protein